MCGTCRKVQDDIHQELVRKGLVIVILDFQEQLQNILLGSTVAFSSTLPDELQSIVANQVLVVFGLLTDTRQQLTDLPGGVFQTLTTDLRQVIKRDSEWHLMFNVVQTAKALSERDTNRVTQSNH